MAIALYGKKRKRIRPLLRGGVWLRWKRGGRGRLNETNSDIRAAMHNTRCMCAPGASPLLPPPQPRAAHAHTFDIEQRQATCVRLKMSVKKQNEQTLRRCPAGRLPLHRWWSILKYFKRQRFKPAADNGFDLHFVFIFDTFSPIVTPTLGNGYRKFRGSSRNMYTVYL